jgi:hypothetical protein
LFCAIENKLWRVAEVLIHHSATPNHTVTSGDYCPAWVCLLKVTCELAIQYAKPEIELMHLSLLSLFLEKGASPRAKCQGLELEHIIELIFRKLKGPEYGSDKTMLDQEHKQSLKQDGEERRRTYKRIRL